MILTGKKIVLLKGERVGLVFQESEEKKDDFDKGKNVFIKKSKNFRGRGGNNLYSGRGVGEGPLYTEKKIIKEKSIIWIKGKIVLIE